jgi:acetylglutamate kinase
MKNTACIKIGGSTIDSPGLLGQLGHASAKLMGQDIFPVVIHGGGKDIGRQLSLLNKKFSFIEGMRVTDAETMQTVQMVLSGHVNKRIVNEFIDSGVNALGISGVDAGLFEAEKLLANGQDIGFVGTIISVNTRIIEICREKEIVPIVSPVSRSRSGEIFNVNADLAAAELAKTLRAEHLLYISDVDGVMVDGEIVHEIRTGEIEGLAKSAHITGGMLPKLRSAAAAVSSGVGRVHVCGWHGTSSLLEEIHCEKIKGTVVY